MRAIFAANATTATLPWARAKSPRSQAQAAAASGARPAAGPHRLASTTPPASLPAMTAAGCGRCSRDRRATQSSLDLLKRIRRSARRVPFRLRAPAPCRGAHGCQPGSAKWRPEGDSEECISWIAKPSSLP
jgi:hypothetical protein